MKARIEERRHSGAVRGFIADGTRNPLFTWIGMSGFRIAAQPALVAPLIPSGVWNDQRG